MTLSEISTLNSKGRSEIGRDLLNTSGPPRGGLIVDFVENICPTGVSWS
jgi:hypothetical protein